MLVVCIVVVLALVGLVAAWVSSWLASGARARSIADAVAISSAQAQQSGRPACEVAEQAALANQAKVVTCAVTTGWGEFVVDVTVEVQLLPQVAGAPQQIRAESRAGVVSGIP